MNLLNVKFHPVSDNGLINFDIPLSGEELVTFYKEFLCDNFVAVYDGTRTICAKIKIFGGDF